MTAYEALHTWRRWTETVPPTVTSTVRIARADYDGPRLDWAADHRPLCALPEEAVDALVDVSWPLAAVELRYRDGRHSVYAAGPAGDETEVALTVLRAAISPWDCS
jgi:hypothetical protein